MTKICKCCPLPNQGWGTRCAYCGGYIPRKVKKLRLLDQR